MQHNIPSVDVLIKIQKFVLKITKIFLIFSWSSWGESFKRTESLQSRNRPLCMHICTRGFRTGVRTYREHQRKHSIETR